MITAEYIWIDGSNPTKKLRSKTKVLPVGVWAVDEGAEAPSPTASIEETPKNSAFRYKLPEWGFDGSSTNQASGTDSDCILKPVRAIADPFRRKNSNNLLVLCEVLGSSGNPHKTNTRHLTAQVAERISDQKWLFGMEQEYTLYVGDIPLGWPERGPAQPQGKYYCGVGVDEVSGYGLVEDHMAACLNVGIPYAGRNAEVMPGQWEYQIGPSGPLEVADYLWLSRYILYTAGIKYGITVRLDPKPLSGDWNGAGLHTNFSSVAMREKDGIVACEESARALGDRFSREGFPSIYGHGFKKRLTGQHETCSFEEFKYGVGDRTASVRIPLNVSRAKAGYIEDRRPCANADPYEIVTYLMETCG